jgi:hypothetical protein
VPDIYPDRDIAGTRRSFRGSRDQTCQDHEGEGKGDLVHSDALGSMAIRPSSVSSPQSIAIA